jgi:hypothetical protein
MQLDMVTIQGAFLDNVGASEALLQLPATHEVEPSVTWIGQPHARNQNQGTVPHGRQRSSTFEVCSNGSFYYSLWMDLLAGAEL